MPASGFFDTGNISVFPSTYRIVDAAGRYTSESNFANILRALSDTKDDGFVVDFTGSSISSPGTLKFVIYGYYFEIRNFTPTSHKNRTFYINVKNGYLVNVNNDSTTLDSTTDGFLGLTFNTKSGDNIKSLKVTDGNGNIINRGFITGLSDSSTGNWMDISKFSGIKIIESGANKGKIDATSIDFSTLSRYTYLINVITEGATKLGSWGSNTFTPYKVGSNTANAAQPIYFETGIPKELTVNSGANNKPVYLNSGKITPINATVGGKGLSREEMYISNGTFTKGNKITISTSIPSGTGENGDLWFVIGG